METLLCREGYPTSLRGVRRLLRHVALGALYRPPCTSHKNKNFRPDNSKSYSSIVARESFRTPKGSRFRTGCNITHLPPAVL
jgi:hypothetical protein